MNIILLIIVIVLVFILIKFWVSKLRKIREAEKRKQDEAGRQASEQVMGSERKLHEEEKKRWEDEYYKRH